MGALPIIPCSGVFACREVLGQFVEASPLHSSSVAVLEGKFLCRLFRRLHGLCQRGRIGLCRERGEVERSCGACAGCLKGEEDGMARGIIPVGFTRNYNGRGKRLWICLKRRFRRHHNQSHHITHRSARHVWKHSRLPTALNISGKQHHSQKFHLEVSHRVFVCAE